MPYFLTNFKRVRYFNLVGEKSFFRPNYRLTLDYPEDLKLFKIIIKKLKNKANLKNIIRLLDNNPDLPKINIDKKNPYYWI